MKKNVFVLFILLSFRSGLFAQALNTPLLRSFYLDQEKEQVISGSIDHTALKPFLYSRVDSTLKDSTTNKYKAHDAISIELAFLPIAGAEYGYTLKPTKSTYNYWGGINGGFSIGKKLAINTTFIWGNIQQPNYMDSISKYTRIVPGLGTAYGKSGYYSYQLLTGYISYSPSKLFNFQLGNDKHFWGEGYRSLFISDVASPYPYFKFTMTPGKVKYTFMLSAQKDATTALGINDRVKDKYGVFHYLSWNIGKRLNLGVFESIVWQGNDSTRNRSFDVNYLNPFAFFRPVEYSLGSSDNALLGMNYKIKLFQKQIIYGQILLDEFLLSEMLSSKGWWGNKYGIQIGLKSFDLFKINNLFLQTEFNLVRPYTYAHANAQQNYGHMNQPLAHPLGANFVEWVSFLNYKYKKWKFEIKLQYAIYGADVNGKDYGKNIFYSYTQRTSDYGVSLLQGDKTTLINTGITFSRMIVPSFNLQFDTGINLRTETNSTTNTQTPYFWIGIKTPLFNNYSDF